MILDAMKYQQVFKQNWESFVASATQSAGSQIANTWLNGEGRGDQISFWYGFST